MRTLSSILVDSLFVGTGICVFKKLYVVRICTDYKIC